MGKIGPPLLYFVAKCWTTTEIRGADEHETHACQMYLDTRPPRIIFMDMSSMNMYETIRHDSSTENAKFILLCCKAKKKSRSMIESICPVSTGGISILNAHHHQYVYPSIRLSFADALDGKSV